MKTATEWADIFNKRATSYRLYETQGALLDVISEIQQETWNDAIEAARELLLESAEFHMKNGTHAFQIAATCEMSRAEDLFYMKKPNESGGKDVAF